MEFRRVAANVYDVFQGTQWGTHSRVRQTRNGVYVMQGEKLPHRTLKWLNSVLAPNMPINYGQPQEQTIYNCQVLSELRA